MSSTAPRNLMRERFREQVRKDIKDAALAQLAAGGPQAVSINAIAKQLGVSGPALYRYFANRDGVVTALVIDAYGDLRDALARAAETDPAGGGAAQRVRALATAYRAWALHELHRYELLFRPPVPGYDAHAVELAAAARELMGILLAALAGLAPDAPEEVLDDRGALTGQFQLAVSVWARLHGILSLELGGGFSAMHLDADALFETEVRGLEEQIGRA